MDGTFDQNIKMLFIYMYGKVPEEIKYNRNGTTI